MQLFKCPKKCPSKKTAYKHALIKTTIPLTHTFKFNSVDFSHTHTVKSNSVDFSHTHTFKSNSVDFSHTHLNTTRLTFSTQYQFYYSQPCPHFLHFLHVFSRHSDTFSEGSDRSLYSVQRNRLDCIVPEFKEKSNRLSIYFIYTSCEEP